MSVHFEVIHQTEYRYSTPVLISRHALHLDPRELPYQKILRSEMKIDPVPTARHSRKDYFGNRVSFFGIAEPHSQLLIECLHEVELFERCLPSPSITAPWEHIYPFLIANSTRENLKNIQFRYPSPLVPALGEIREWAQVSFPPERPILEAALDLNERIFNAFTFDPTATTVSTPLSEVFKRKRGVCQDFTHFQIACFRAMGIPARYVSGYLRTLPPPGEIALFGADASHAWTSVYCLNHGWIDLDPTNNKLVNQSHITLGWGRDYSDVSLISGVLSGGGTHDQRISVNVRELAGKKK